MIDVKMLLVLHSPPPPPPLLPSPPHHHPPSSLFPLPPVPSSVTHLSPVLRLLYLLSILLLPPPSPSSFSFPLPPSPPPSFISRFSMHHYLFTLLPHVCMYVYVCMCLCVCYFPFYKQKRITRESMKIEIMKE